MDQLFINLLKTARPRQWIKNLTLYAPLIFSGRLFIGEDFLRVTFAIFIFSGITSSIYFLNDIIDIPRDKVHPFKRLRPIASGKLPVPIAFFVAIVGILVSFFLASRMLFFFFLVCFTYFILQIFYSLFLKEISIIDVLAIASGFILRIYAGAIILNYHVSSWFLLCVISVALFLAVGKRRSELAMLAGKDVFLHRKTLSIYSENLLDAYLSIFATSAWVSWALFTFFESQPVILKPSLLYLVPLTIAGSNKLLMLTIPVVIYGVMRYLKIIYEGSKAESPERVLLYDKPLLGTIILWGAMLVLIIYGVG